MDAAEAVMNQIARLRDLERFRVRLDTDVVLQAIADFGRVEQLSEREMLIMMVNSLADQNEYLVERFVEMSFRQGLQAGQALRRDLVESVFNAAVGEQQSKESQ